MRKVYVFLVKNTWVLLVFFSLSRILWVHTKTNRWSWLGMILLNDRGNTTLKVNLGSIFFNLKNNFLVRRSHGKSSIFPIISCLAEILRIYFVLLDVRSFHLGRNAETMNHSVLYSSLHREDVMNVGRNLVSHVLLRT